MPETHKKGTGMTPLSFVLALKMRIIQANLNKYSLMFVKFM